MNGITRKILGTGIAVTALALVGCAEQMAGSMMTQFSVTLNGAAEVPAVAVPGSGSATVTLDKGSKMLTWNVAYSGLTGPARAAHFHGPAAPGVIANPIVPITVSNSPMTGTAQLTDAQIADLVAGKWYVNIHTAANGGGEIRGQVVPAR